MIGVEFEPKKCDECGGMGGEYTWNGPETCDTCGGYGYEPDYNKPINGRKGMNYSTSVMLINEEIRAISCSYEPNVLNRDGSVSHYTPRRIFKTLDKTIKPGDYVVVPTNTRHCMTVNKVEEVDVDINFEDSTEVFWAICKVDTETAKAIHTREAEWVTELKKVERKHQKEKLKEKVLGAYKVDDLKVLSFTGQHDASVLSIEKVKDAAEQPAKE